MSDSNKIYNEYCAKCKLNKGRDGDNINCGYSHSLRPLDFEVCAACEFTDEAWNKYYNEHPERRPEWRQS